MGCVHLSCEKEHGKLVIRRIKGDKSPIERTFERIKAKPNGERFDAKQNPLLCYCIFTNTFCALETTVAPFDRQNYKIVYFQESLYSRIIPFYSILGSRCFFFSHVISCIECH